MEYWLTQIAGIFADGKCILLHFMSLAHFICELKAWKSEPIVTYLSNMDDKEDKAFFCKTYIIGLCCLRTDVKIQFLWPQVST